MALAMAFAAAPVPSRMQLLLHQALQECERVKHLLALEVGCRPVPPCVT